MNDNVIQFPNTEKLLWDILAKQLQSELVTKGLNAGAIDWVLTDVRQRILTIWETPVNVTLPNDIAAPIVEKLKEEITNLKLVALGNLVELEIELYQARFGSE